MLKGKTAIVTGSTSGIGLGIARALGGAGANLMLNGFGDAAQIEALRAGLAKEFGVKVAFSGADMSKPAQIREMVEIGDEGTRRGRHPGQQRRHPAHVAGRRVPGRPLGRGDRHQPVIRLPRDQGGAAADEAPQLGPHRQHRLDARPGRLGGEVGLRGRQARRAGADQDGGAGDGQDRHHLQRDLPRLGADAAGAEADRRAGQARAGSRSSRRSATCWPRSSPPANSPRPSRSAPCACSCARRPRPRSAARRCRSMAAGWPSNGHFKESRSLATDRCRQLAENAARRTPLNVSRGEFEHEEA